MRILTLLARHGRTKYPDAVPSVRDLFALQFPGTKHRLLVVDNALPMGHRSEEEGIEVIGASNEGWEFSAWDAAIAEVGDELNEFDWINLATSAYRQLYNRYLDLFTGQLLSSVRHLSPIIGHVDYSDNTYNIFGTACSSWVRSSFIFVKPSSIRIIKNIDSGIDRKSIFSGDPLEPFRADAAVSPAYRRNITAWLTGEGTGQGVEWHSRFVLSEETLSFFEAKVLAILNEQSLTNRFRAAGCPIVDVTWLSGVKIPIPLPDWREQITHRPIDAAPSTIRLEVLPSVFENRSRGWHL